MNRSERYVYSLARRTSLSLWSYATPIRGGDGKELCDVLVVFGNDIAIISVKEIRLGIASWINLRRWRRRAIESSVKQIYGAERWIRTATHVVKSDRTQGLKLPSPSQLKVHRIAVALGSKGLASVHSGDFGKGFVHVFDEPAFDIILGELDTAADLFSYLNEKVAASTHASRILMEGGEEDLLATYLANNRSLPRPSGILLVGVGIWDDFATRPEYIRKKEAEKASRIWDRLIETVAKDALEGNLEFGPSLSDTELALRKMAAEDRYQRRLLGAAFEEFLEKSLSSIRSRLVTSESGTTYVFLATPHGAERKDRATELAARCFVARGRIRENPTVVGIATEQYIPGSGFSLDLIYLSKPDWTSDDEQSMEELLAAAPYFRGPMRHGFGEAEYPS